MRRSWVIIPLLGGAAYLSLLAFLGPMGGSEKIGEAMFPPSHRMPSSQAPTLTLAEAPPVVADTQPNLAALEALALPPQRTVAAPPITANMATPVFDPPPLAPPVEEKVVPQPPSPEQTATSEEQPQPVEPSTWPRPLALEAQLRTVTQESQTRVWAYAVQDALTELRALPLTEKEASQVVFSQLAALAAAAPNLAEQATSENLRRDLLTLAYDISRRVGIWRAAMEVESLQTILPVAHDEGLSLSMLAAIEQIESYLGADKYTAAWARYLKFSDLAALDVAQAIPLEDRAAVARQVLYRMSSRGLTTQQRELLQKSAFADFEILLRRWATQSVDVVELLHILEDFEYTENASSAFALAEFIDQLQYSVRQDTVSLAAQLEKHYRNANVRFAVARELINRSLPESQPTAEEVRDRILKANVTGRSTTATRVSLDLTPDPAQWNFNIVANGQVRSDTASDAGPAVFFSNGRARFQVRKQFHWTPKRLSVEPASATVRSSNELVRVATDYDKIPLFGALAQTIATQQHDQHAFEANRIVERKIAVKAERRMDREVGEQFNLAYQQFEKKILGPLRLLGVEPRSMSLQTTSQRLISRSRLAGASQLAAFTARPRAPSDSWFSVQIHQSMVNNVLNQLAVGGRPLKLRALLSEIHTRLGLQGRTPPADLPENVWLLLSEDEPLKISCSAGSVHCVVRLQQLKHGRRRWKNLVVRAEYTPVIEGMVLTMRREKPIELTGDRLSFGDQIALRAVFSKVFSKRRPPVLSLPKALGEDKTRGLEITQFVLHRGWIGLAVAPRRGPNASPAAEVELAADPKRSTASRPQNANQR